VTRAAESPRWVVLVTTAERSASIRVRALDTACRVGSTEFGVIMAETDSRSASVAAERVLRAAVEILRGRRPAKQLSAVLSPDLLTYLVSLQVTAGHLQPRVRKVLAQQHAGGALEAVALVTLSTGVRALAARFDKHDCRWQCTALQLHLTPGDLATHRGRPTR